MSVGSTSRVSPVYVVNENDETTSQLGSFVNRGNNESTVAKTPVAGSELSTLHSLLKPAAVAKRRFDARVTQHVKNLTLSPPSNSRVPSSPSSSPCKSVSPRSPTSSTSASSAPVNSPSSNKSSAESWRHWKPTISIDDPESDDELPLDG